MEVPELAEVPFTVPLAVAAVQAKLAPVGIDVKAMFVAVPLQVVADAGVAVAVGFGFTVTATVIGEPVQLFNVGVTV
jgi:hypothetical protein